MAFALPRELKQWSHLHFLRVRFVQDHRGIATYHPKSEQQRGDMSDDFVYKKILASAWNGYLAIHRVNRMRWGHIQ